MPGSVAAKQTAMTKQEIEALGKVMLEDHGLRDCGVRAVCEEDDTGDPEDDIGGRYGCAFYEERLIWVNMRYADDPTVLLEACLFRATGSDALSKTRRLGRFIVGDLVARPQLAWAASVVLYGAC